MQLAAECSGGRTTLRDVLARPDIWRGDALANAPVPGVSTGFPALNAELPGGGWPRGGLVELLPARTGIGELALLMPALKRLSVGERAWIVCVALPHGLCAPAWAAAGIDLAQLVVIRAKGDDVVWACAQALGTEGVGALLAWLPACHPGTLRRLQLLAERSRTTAFMFRPSACATQSSPAALRLVLDVPVADAADETLNRLAVHVLKRRGGGGAAQLQLQIPRPGRKHCRTSFALQSVMPDILNVPNTPNTLNTPVEKHDQAVAESHISKLPA